MKKYESLPNMLETNFRGLFGFTTPYDFYVKNFVRFSNGWYIDHHLPAQLSKSLGDDCGE